MQTFSGFIISNKMKDTVTVNVPYTVRHPKYHKILKRSTKLLAHTDKKLEIGQKVKIAKCRPYSKNTHFKVTAVIPSNVEGSHK